MESSEPKQPSREDILSGLKRAAEGMDFAAAKAEAIKAKRSELRDTTFNDLEEWFKLRDELDAQFMLTPDPESPEIQAILKKAQVIELSKQARITQFQEQMNVYFKSLREPENPNN